MDAWRDPSFQKAAGCKGSDAMAANPAGPPAFPVQLRLWTDQAPAEPGQHAGVAPDGSALVRVLTCAPAQMACAF